MPGFDGTGPFGQGPMTGQCRGFCILKASEVTSEVEGFVGIDGKPVGAAKTNKGSISTNKEVINMPAGDRTGPAGFGPMTGRAAGYCAGYPVPGYMNPVIGAAGYYGAAMPAIAPYGAAQYSPAYRRRFIPWLRRGFGFGRGRGRGGGRFGFRW